MANQPTYNPNCFLAAHGLYERGEMPPCSGRLIKAHLIPQQVLKREGVEDVWRDAWWVWACGGPTGCGGHHGMFDMARTLRLPRLAIPRSTERAAGDIGLGWWLERTYRGPVGVPHG